MKTKTLLFTLLLCSSTTFVLILSIYAFWNGRNPFNRMGYGVFISLVPALFALLAPKFAKASRVRIAATYALLFSALIVVQALLR